MPDRRLLRGIDPLLILLVVALICIGLAAVYSATTPSGKTLLTRHVKKQAVAAAVGLAAAAALCTVSYRRILRCAYGIYALCLALLVLVLLVGQYGGGAQRWLRFGPVSFQPSEVAKIAVVLALSRYLGGLKEGIRLRDVAVAVALAAVPAGLIAAQPDLGTALVMVPALFVCLTVSGARWKHLSALALGVVACVPVGLRFLRDYQLDRLLVFIDPSRDPAGAGYAVAQSKIALGAGGMFGRGWRAGTQSQLNFLPESHTDFVFPVIGEEWGFVGSCVVLGLYLLLLLRSAQIASTASDASGRILAAGLTSVLAVHVLVNIAMCAGLAPVVGLPLPFMSYGGSALVSAILSTGLILNVRMRRLVY